MLVVIADDLSGAAELAGAALRHGLAAGGANRLRTPPAKADVICVDTDSRSLPPGEAARVVRAVARMPSPPRGRIGFFKNAIQRYAVACCGEATPSPPPRPVTPGSADPRGQSLSGTDCAGRGQPSSTAGCRCMKPPLPVTRSIPAAPRRSPPCWATI